MSSIKLFENQAKISALKASTALQEAAQYAPSRWSSGLQVSQAYPNMTTPVVAASSDTVERDAQRLRDERMLEDAPRTAAWVVDDPVNAGLAVPFVPQLYEVEKSAQWEAGGALVRGGVSGATSAYYGVTNAFSFTSRFEPVSAQVTELEFMDRVDNGDLSPQDVELLEHAGMMKHVEGFKGIDYLRANPAVRQAMREKREREVDEYIEENPEVFVELAKAYKSYLTLQKEMNLSKPITEVGDLDDFTTWLGESVGQLGPQVIGSAVMSVIMRRPALITGANMAFAGAQLAGEGIAKALDGDPRKMYDPEVGKGVITAAIVGAGIEKFGVPARIAGRLAGDLSDSFADMLYQSVMRRVGANASVDAFSEAMTEVLQETVLDLIILGESATSIEEYIDMAARGAVGGGVVSVVSAPFSEARLQRHLDRVAQSKDQSARIAQVNRTAAALEMRGTAPDKARSYLQSVYQDRQIYVDPVALQRWADDSGSSVESIGVTQAQIDAAAESGNKVAIPLADYAAVVPGTDGAKWFEENGTTDPNMPSAADAQAVQEVTQQLLEEYQRAAEIDATIEETRTQLVTQFEEQLTAAGRPSATVQFEARAAAEMVLGLARATGDETAALELAQRFGLRVEGPLASQDAGSGAAPGVSPSSAPGAVLSQPGQQVPGFMYDNPGGDWLERKQREAEEDMAAAPRDRRARASMRGAVTAASPTNLSFSTLDLRALRGLMNEARGPGDPQYDALLKDVQENGWQDDQRGNRVVVGVNHRGEAYLLEGNTRVAVAMATGVDRVNAEVRYWNGGEQVPGEWHPAEVQQRAEGARTLDQSAVVTLTPEEQAKVNPIYTGKVPAKKLRGVAAAARWLEDQYQGEPITDFTKSLDQETLQSIGRVMAVEAIAALRNSNNASDWYSGAIERAIDTASLKWPMLKSDEAAAEAGFGTASNARFAFTYIMAVTSQNLPVDFNAVATNKAFDAMVERVASGDFTMDPDWGTGDKKQAMASNFKKFGPLVDAMDGDSFPEKLANLDALFREKRTVKEWVDSMKAAGIPYSRPGQTAVDAVVYGSSLLGPKIGNGFWQNLNGNFDPLTIDLWMRRTWGRLTGKSIGNESALAGQRRRLKASVQRAIKSPERDTDTLIPVLNEQRQMVQALQALEGRTDLSVKDKNAQRRALKKQIKELKEVAADLRAAPPPEPWKAVYGKDDAELAKYAKRLVSAWDKTYKQLRQKYPGGVPAKLQPTWVRGAKRLKADLTTPLDQVANGTQRKQIEAAARYAQQLLAENGVSVTTADLQAILWYPEKELWNALSSALDVDEDGDPIIPRSRLNESYDTAFARILRREGYGEEQGAAGDGGEPGGGGALAGDAGTGPGSDGQQGEGLAGQGGQGGQGEAVGEAGVQGASAQDGAVGGAAGRAPRTLSQGGLGKYDPLPGAPRGVGGPIPELVDIAEKYAADAGIPYSRQALYVPVDEEFAKRIADAYEEMKHDPSDPKVKEAYEDLARQTRAQYDALVEGGYSFSFFGNDDDPYNTSPVAAIRDLRENKRMAVYATAAGYGTGSTVNIGLADPQGGPDLTAEAVLEKVRAVAEVVDYSVHQSDTEQTLVVKLKNKLDPAAGDKLSADLGQEAIAERFDDETGALHGPMAEQWGPYNPEFFVMPDGKRASEVANPLLADTGLRWKFADGTEEKVTVNDLFRAVHDAFGHGLEGAGFRAQGEENAWQAHSRLFHGPALGALTSETRGQNSWLNYGPYGETNRTAGLFDTVFAEQKTGLMPEWTWTENVAPAMPETRTLEQPAMHGTPNPDPFDRFDLSFMGTGEGVQAYGWGLYFATLRGVAEHYRNMRQGMRDPHGNVYDVGLGSGQFGDLLTSMAGELSGLGITLPEDQLDFLVGDYVDSGTSKSFEEFVRSSDRVMYNLEDTRDQILEAARALDTLGFRLEGGGRIYHVDIPGNDELFYYDAPMRDQPPELRARLIEALEGQAEAVGMNDPSAAEDWQWVRDAVAVGTITFETAYDNISMLMRPSAGTRPDAFQTGNARAEGDKAASEWLRDVVGVPGHRFLDNKSRGNDVNDPDNTFNFVIYDDAAVNIREFEQSQPLGPRANITMPAGALGESVIKLMAGADVTSFLHEMGHWWLEAFHTLATSPSAGEAMQRDMAIINRWLGRDADDKTPFTEDQHEQWARGVERYVYEGKAPSRGLRPLFKAMASFMTGVYQSAQQLNVEISPEIRELMDRMFASQKALAEARGETGAGPVLGPELAALGMNKANWEAYSKLAAESEGRASAEHLEAAMAELRKRRAGDYKDELEAERGRVEERLRQEPVYQLILGLGMKDGLGDTARMDRAEVLELFGQGGLDDLKSTRHGVQRNLYITEGSPMEYVAAHFGFANAEQMMQAIRGAQPLDQAVEAEARKIVDARLGEEMSEEAMLREAHAAYHNDTRMELLAYEALALDTEGKALKGPEARAALLERIRERASDIVDGMPVAQIIKLEALLEVERRAGKEAENALRKIAQGAGAQEFAKAKAAKARQVLAAAVWNEARKRERSIERTRRLAMKLHSNKERAKIHRSFLPHILALLERFDFRKSQQPGTRELPNIYELMSTLAEENAGVVPPGLVLQPGIPGGRKPYSRLSGAEMRAVGDQLTNLVKLGKEAQQEENEQIKNTRAAKAGTIAAGIRQRFGTRDIPRSKSERGALHKMAANLRGLYAVTRNIFGITRSLDGNNDNGAFFQYILRPIQQAAARAEERSEAGRKRLTEILEKHYDAKARRDLNKPIMRDEVGLRLSHADVLSLALNAGNDGNWARVVHESNHWTEEGVRTLLRNVMTENDWRYVQAVWDEINTYWSEVAALEQKHTGLEPDKVAGKIMVDAPAFVRGGYYPIVYDGEMSARIQELEWKTLQDAGLSGHFSKVMTRHGHTEQRGSGARRALQLGLDPMFRHVNQVVRDLEMRDAVIEAHKILNQRELVDTMDQAGLREIHHALLAWIKDVAAGEASRSGGINGFARHVRRNVSLSRMAFSLTTASLQPLGLFQSGELIGWGTLLRGMVKSYSGNRAAYEAAARSTIMRDRRRTMDRDMQQILRDARAAPPRSASIEDLQNWVGRYGFWAIQQLQYYVVDVPTWTAVYDRELRRGQDEESARAIADRMLTEAQGSGSQLDRSAVERGRLDLDPQSGQGHELIRLFTVMGSYMVNKWNRASSRAGQLKRGEIGPLQFAVSMIQLLVLEAALTAALRSALGDDEDEDMLDAVAMRVAQDIVGTVPVAGPIASGFVGGRGGTTALTGYFKDLARALQEAGDAAVDEEYEFDRAALSSLVTALGSTTGAPSVVLNRAIKAVFDEDLRPVDDPASRMIRGQLGGRLE